MKFGYKEIKEFAENHEDERVRIMYRRLCEARSKNAKWCEEIERLRQQNQQLYDSLPVIDNRTKNIAVELLNKPFNLKQAKEVIESLISENTKLKEENKQLRLGWCRESEKRMKEWQPTTVGTTGCEICNNAGHVDVTYLHQDGKISTGWTKCAKCNT